MPFCLHTYLTYLTYLTNRPLAANLYPSAWGTFFGTLYIIRKMVLSFRAQISRGGDGNVQNGERRG